MKKYIKIFGIVLLCLFLIMFIFGIGYSKYSNSEKVKVSTNIATPKIFIEKGEEKVVENLNENVILYEFSIKNYDEILSDVSFNYYIKFELSQENAPVSINLYRINEDSETVVNLNEDMTSELETIGLEETENFYRLELLYDKSSEQILDKDFNVNIYMQAVQLQDV